MKITRMFVMGISLGIIAIFFMGSAQAGCKTVNGHISSEVFTDGCPSPLGLCTFGRFIGGIQGDFIFVAEAIIPNPESAEVAFTTGSIDVETKKGNLTLKDASAVSFGADGLFGSVQTVVGGTGDFTDATGRIRAYGVFLGGCVNCDYRGEICTP